MNIQSKTVYNFAYFGGNRETVSFNGHYNIIKSETEFLIIKIGGYGNFTSYTQCDEIPVLSESEIRYVNDFILTDTDRFNSPTTEQVQLFLNNIKYPLSDKLISANIFYGDTVLDLETNETFIMSDFFDIMLVRRNHFHKVMNREVHPEPATKEEFLNKLNTIDPFKNWKVCDELPKKSKLYSGMGNYLINDKLYKFYSHSDLDIYYAILSDGSMYSLKSGISAPCYDTIDLLTGKIHVEYIDGNPNYSCMFECKHLESEEKYNVTMKFVPRRFKLFTEEKSFHYNNALTRI